MRNLQKIFIFLIHEVNFMNSYKLYNNRIIFYFFCLKATSIDKKKNYNIFKKLFKFYPRQILPYKKYT